MNLNSINNKPTCDNECDLYGWTHEYLISRQQYESNFHVSVHPDADIDADVRVFCHDTQQCMTIGGYNWMWERLNG